MCHWLGIVDPTNLPFAEVVYVERAEKVAHKPSLKGSWPWSVARMLRQLGTMLGPRS
jgi:hypothetical protein